MQHLRMTYLTDGHKTSFRFPFKVDQDTDLRVFLIDPLDLEHYPLFPALDYSVTAVGNSDGGTIELTPTGLKKAAAGLKLVIKYGQAYLMPESSGAGCNGLDLSYEEQWTGRYDRTDPDGPKKIYAKTFETSNLTDTNTQAQREFDVLPANFRRAISISGVSCYDEINYYSALPQPGEDNRHIIITTLKNANNKQIIRIYWRGNYSIRTIRATIEYTKNE